MAPPADTSPASTPTATTAVTATRVGGDQAADPSPPPARVDAAAACVAYDVSPRVARSAAHASYERKPGDPLYRPLRIFTLDPSVPRADGPVAIVNVPYEPLDPGPQGKRFRVLAGDFPLDFADDAASTGLDAAACSTTDLDDRRVLMQNGLTPSSTNPAFHDQMAYAVCSNVYAAFRVALGREVPWAFDSPQLDLVPHAKIRSDADGPCYTRADDQRTGALNFVWTEATAAAAKGMMPKERVFTCLSHDIVAHEVTHALLDGLRAKFAWRGNPDVAAFHEGFADLVAILQRLSYREVVRGAMTRRCGKGEVLDDLLQVLGGQFARARDGKPSARDIDLPGDTLRYDAAMEPHVLGAVLVSAVLDAYRRIYAAKTARYLRLATGSGRMLAPDAALPSDLLDLLSHTASRLAGHFLNICIRAIDYCPPVDIELGEYLRALVTADFDLVPDDVWGYREALIAAFGRRGIFPTLGVGSMTEDALRWREPRGETMTIPELSFAELRFEGDPGRPWGESELNRRAHELGQFISDPSRIEQFGCVDPCAGDRPDLRVGKLVVESVRSSRRIGPDGQVVFDLVAEVTQHRHDPGGDGLPAGDFYGGATIILGPGGEVRYLIAKRVTDDRRLARSRRFRPAARGVTYAHPFCSCRPSAEAVAELAPAG